MAYTGKYEYYRPRTPWVRAVKPASWLQQYLSSRAGPVTTLGALAASMDGSRQEVKEHCMKALSDVGASDTFCTPYLTRTPGMHPRHRLSLPGVDTATQLCHADNHAASVKFFGEVLQCEHDMNTALYRFQQGLKEDISPTASEPQELLKSIQDMTKNFNLWKGTIDALAERGKDVPPLNIDPEKAAQHSVLNALCSLQTKEVCVTEGDQITITDTSQPNRLRVRTTEGEEGVVPTLCCILPTPDRSALTAAERLRIQLVAAWTECVRKAHSLLMRGLVTTYQKLVTDWSKHTLNGTKTTSDRVSRRFRRIQEASNKNCDFVKLHNALFSLEKELNSYNTNGNGNNTTKMVETVSTLDKAVLCYQMFIKQWYLYRKTLEREPRPIRVVDHLVNLRPPGNGRNYKYYEYKTTVENVETVEEIVYVEKEKEEEVTGGGKRNETVQSDQITSTQQEERKRFIIRSVLRPSDQKEISIQDAIAQGIVDQSTGTYVQDSVTGAGIPIPEAMNLGFIKVDYTTVTKTKEETKAIGLITIKTKTDNRPYTIVGAMDPVTGEKLKLDEARKRGLLNESEGYFLLCNTGEKLSIADAVSDGWILAEYDPASGEPDYDEKTYAINSVVDQRAKKKVPFYEAVKRGLINKETGNYINNVTGERIYVGEAIRRGFLKGKVVDDPSGLDIEAENKMVIERMDKIRKNVVKKIGVITAFREARRRSNSQSSDHGDEK